MNAAPCSWRTVMWRMASVCDNASRTSSVSSPGTEKTYSQPSASRQATSSSAAVATGGSVRARAGAALPGGSGGRLDRPEELPPPIQVERDQVFHVQRLDDERAGRP